MTWVDWAIVIAGATLMTLLCVRTARHLQGVADFLAANRSAGRYMLALSGSIAGFGAIAVVAYFEIYYSVGFPPVWWEMLMFPATAVALMSGWLIYRFREARCLTMAQFFEVRYSRKFRIYAGILTWVAGIVNFGIFPIVSTRFFIYFCDLPPTVDLLGISIQTIVPLLAVTLGLSLLYATLGGYISVMITDCAQGIVCTIGTILLTIFVLHKFGWTEISGVLLSKEATGTSFLNPYNTSDVQDFNAWFYLISIFGMFYGFISWQGNVGANSCALSPHEAKMGAIIQSWRVIPQNVMIVIIPVAVIAFLALPKYSEEVAKTDAVMQSVESDYLATQVRVSAALPHILPTGLRGLFCTMMLFYLTASQQTYLHSWGAVFIQDVVLPLRKRPLTPEQHVRLLRLSIVIVAVFAFFFSIFYKQTTYIRMFQAITGALVAGAGAVIIGGLYWRRGSTAAAWVAMTAGLILSATRIILDTVKPSFGSVVDRGWSLQFMDWLTAPNQQVYWFYTMLFCIGSYIVVSLLTSRQPFNLERMLHRGNYDTGMHVEAEERPRSIWLRVINITSEFTIADRFVSVGLLSWYGGWLLIFVGATVYSLLPGGGFSAESWALFWHCWIWVNLIVGIPITVWTVVGGWRDIRRCLERLKTLERDDRDDGRVVGHHLADEVEVEEFRGQRTGAGFLQEKAAANSNDGNGNNGTGTAAWPIEQPAETRANE